MPKPLFYKLIAQAAVGFFCVLIGIVYGIQSGDLIFIMLSVLIGFGNILHICSFYRLIRRQDYLVLTGICIKRDSMSFKKTQQITFLDEMQREYVLSLEKNIKVYPGHYYQLYFHQPAIPNPDHLKFSSANLLGYEELPAVTEYNQNFSGK